MYKYEKIKEKKERKEIFQKVSTIKVYNKNYSL